MTRPPRPLRLLALPTALVLALAAAPPAARPAAAQYEALETRDLRLVYPGRALHFIAPYTAQCFENSLAFHERLFGYKPSEKVNVILDDFADYGNAGVWASPRNSMLVHIAPANFVYETGPSNERMNATMNHEVVHVVALDEAAGRDKLFRGLFHGKVKDDAEHPETILYGYLTLPRRAAPRWYHEGIAVFLDTWMAGGLGRAQGPYDEMVFRAMVRDSAHFYDPLGLESEGTKVDFQVGVNSYLYGTRFMSWLAWRDGPEKLLKWVGRGPGSRAWFASQFAAVYREPLSRAWGEWVQWEHGFQRANLDSVRRWPVTPWRDLAPASLGSVSRAWLDPDGRTLYAAVNYPGTVAHVAAIDLAGRPARALHEVKGPALYFVASLAFDPADRKLFYTSDNNEWRDLCLLDPASGASRTLIRDARIGDLAFDAQDRSLWGVRHFNGISSIVRLAPPWTDWTTVMSFPYGRDVYDLDVSPDGTRLVASMAEVSGRQTLRLWSLEALARGDSAGRVLHDFGSAIPTSFVFTPDGGALLGSSYYTGVSNIFRYDLARDSMDIVTNAETGFFRPVPAGNDSAIVFRYTGAGFRPAKVPIAPLTDVSAITFLGAELVERYPVLEQWKAPSPATVRLDGLHPVERAYPGLAAVRPTTVYPVLEGYKDAVAAGLRLDLSDPIGLHRFGVSASVSPDRRLADDERLHLALGYQRYDLAAKLRWNGASFYDLFGPVKTSRKGYGATLEWKRLLVRDQPRTLELRASLGGWGGLERLPDAQNVATSPGFDKLLTGTVQLDYRNLRASIGAADYEKGWAWRLAAGDDGVRFVRGERAAWRGYPSALASLDAGLPLPLRNSSIWLRTAAGGSPGDPNEPFANTYFGGFGNNWVDHADPKRYREPTSFPGLELDAVGGTSFGRAMLDWNLPPLRFRRLGTLAFYATWARLSLFSTALVTNVDRPDDRRRLADLGAQADLRLQLLTQQPLTFSVGWARAFERGRAAGEEWMVSLKIL